MSGDVNKSVKVTINLVDGVSKKVGSIITSFDKLSKKAQSLAKSVKKINNSLGKIKSNEGIKSLSKDLKSISIGKKNTDSIKTLSENLKNLKDLKFPSFSKFNEDLSKHEKIVKSVSLSYKELEKILKKLKLKNIVTESNSASKSTRKLNDSVKKSKTSFSQLGFAIGSASTGLSKFGTRIYGVTRGFSAISKNMGLAMSAFTTAFTSLFALKGVITDISKFDDAIRGAGAVAQASSVQLTQLSDAARAMGESTRYTAIDAADALKALAMTGLDVNESIATLPTVLNVAAAANMSLGQSADIVTNIMVGYGKTVKDLPKIADLMTAAFTNANTSLSEIGVALKYVGPVANAAGQSLEETTGILASLANAGYRGSKAGVILRTSIANLLSPTNKMKGVLEDYGIAMSDLTKPDGTMHSFTDILALMAEKGLKTGDALTLFGKRAGPGILALLEQGIPALEEMNAKIAASEGIALKVAYEMEEGLGGALRRLKSMWDEVSIAIGKVIEQDVEKFITNLTKSLNKNKEQIVSFVSALFSVFKMLAKVSVGVASFVTEHAKLVLAIGAISLAIKALTLSSATLLEVGLVKYLVGLYSSIKWSGIATGITNVAKGLNAYTIASKSASTAGAASSLTTLGTFKFSNVIGGLKSIGSALIGLGISAAKATVAFIATNPVLVAFAAAAAIAYAAIKILDKDYEGAAKSAIKMANSVKESNRELEYQSAELKLINNEFERDNVKDYSNANDRLSDVIKKTNLSLQDKIKYLKRSSESSDEAKKVIQELTEAINEENSANDIKIIAKTTEAREAQSKAVEAQAKNLEYYYGISIDGQSRLNAQEKIAAATNTLKPILWLKKKLGYLDENIEKYDELSGQQKVIEKNYQNMVARMIVAGKSTDAFNTALKESGASKVTIDNITESFKKLKKEADENVGTMNDLKKLNAESLGAIEENAKRQVDTFKSTNSERESIQKKTLYNIAMLEAKGQLDHESAEMAKLQATLDSSQQQIQAAQELYTGIDELAIESKEKALAEITKAEEKAAGIRLKILEKISKTEEKLNEKISSLSSKRSEETARYDTKTGELREKLSKKQEEAEVKKTEKISEINEKLSDKLSSIEEKLSEKRSKLQEKRVEEIASSAQKISGIESSTEDKLREIQQRGMTDRQKNDSDREAAAKKLQDGQELVAKAEAEGDTAALERGTKLIEQSSELYSGLEKEKEAISGVKETSEALKEAEIVRSKLALASIDEKVLAEEDAAKKSEQIAKDASQREKDKAESGYAKKIQEADSFYEAELLKENENHSKKIANIDALISKNNSKLETIENEKTLVLGLIEEYKKIESFDGGASGWEKANTATSDAIYAVNEYKNTVDGLNDSEVNIKFTGEASPKSPLGDKLKEIGDKFAEISSEIDVNIKFSSNGKDLSAGLKDIKNDIESIEITIPVSAGIEEISAVIALIESYRDIGINIKVNIESGELNNVANILKNMVNKAVAVTMKIIGYDNLVKAKNMIDSIKSKTVTVTTVTRTVSENAAGGYIEPEKYATGGNVFRRLSSPYISKGGGKKDDVPAMLMKGEFVQKVSAVQKYGKNFMAKLNAGLIPQKVIKMFNSGGDVQPEYYASGGHVGYKDLPKKYKKKIFDLLNQRASDVSKNVKDKDVTEMGESSIKRMTDSFSNSVLKFASGGLSDSTNITKEKNEIIKQYSKLIEEEENSGHMMVAETMRNEQDLLLDISLRLKEELDNLKKEYDDYVSDATIAYEEEQSEIDSDHSANTNEINNSHDEDLASAESDKKSKDEENQENYDKKEALYEEEKIQIEVDYENVADEIYKSIIEEKSNLRKLADDIYNFGKRVKIIYNESQQWEAVGEGGASARGGGASMTVGEGTGTLSIISEDYEETPYAADRDNPNKNYLKLLIKTIEETKYKTYDKDALNDELDLLWSELTSSKNNLSELGIRDPISLLSETRRMDLERHAKQISDSRKKEELDKAGEGFSAYKDEYSANKKNTQNEYNESVSLISDSRNADINTENDSYNEKKSDSDNSYNEMMSASKEAYDENVKNTSESYAEETKNTKDETKSSVEIIKEEVLVNIQNLESEKNDQLDSLVESKKEVIEPKDISKPEDQKSIVDLMKKRLKIFGFNTGGFVNSTSDSVPGKDSILSALTPNEYVMKASVVRKFGKGFFDSLNNFRVPQFNMGGIVGGIGGDDLAAPSTTTRYALDLTLNGSKQGELIGSQSTIQSVLNELSMAKLAAQ